ncbi:MAG: PKD domain-containing protein, partial [Blastocatellia bacterium]
MIGLVVAVAVSTKLDWSGLAARRTQAENGANTIPASIRRLPPSSSRGPVLPANANATSLAPLQGCAVSCNATVPGTGQHGAGVQFSAAATPSGCSGQPTFNWNFGDGTPHSTEQNPTHAYATAGAYTWTLTTSVGSGSTVIDTLAGGLGEGNPAAQAPFGVLAAVARDPQGRGIYVADQIGNAWLIRFINTSNASVTLGGRAIAAGTVRAIAGGGESLGDNAPALQADLGAVTGLAVSGNGDLVYFANSIDAQIRAVNVSSNPITISGQSIGSGRIGTLASNLGSTINGLAVNTSTGDVYFCDATAGTNKVFRVPGAGGSPTAVAGNGSTTTEPGDPFSPGPATNIPLLQPRAVEIDGAGDVIIADTGHGRVIRVSNGNASLVNQFPVFVGQTNQNPYPSGVAIVGGSVYVANGNQQTIVRVTGGVSTIAGTPGQACDYTASNCGDDGPATGAGFNMLGSTATPPLAGIEGDQNGLFILDQGVTGRGRIRYINLTGGSVTVGGVTVAAGVIRTVAGSGLVSPYDGGLATGATFNSPVGVAADANNNLWISDTISAKLRFVNRGEDAVTIFANTAAAQTVPAGGIVTVNKNVG